jgi:hypothetical protein
MGLAIRPCETKAGGYRASRAEATALIEMIRGSHGVVRDAWPSNAP